MKIVILAALAGAFFRFKVEWVSSVINVSISRLMTKIMLA